MARKTAQSETKLDFTKSFQKLSPETFYRFIREYPDQQGATVYVFRLLPKIDRRLVGIETKNIDKLADCSAFDEDYLLREHGTGRYMLTFTDSNKPKGMTEVAKCFAEVADPRIEPNLNPLELVVSAPENERIVQRYIEKGYTVDNGKLQAPRREESGTEVLAKTIDRLADQVASKPAQSDAGSDLTRRLLDVVIQQPKPGGDDFERALKLAHLIQPKPDPVLGKLMEVILSRGQANPDPRPDPINQLKETAALLKEFGWGQQSGGGGGSWVDALTALPGILQYGSQMFGQLLAMRAMQSKVVPIAGAALAADAAPAAQPAAPEVDEEMEMFASLLGFNLKTMIEIGEDAIDAFDRGISGSDFAHGLCCRRGGEALFGKLHKMGKDELLKMLAMVPAINEKLAPRRAEIEAWLDGFMSYGSETDSEAA